MSRRVYECVDISKGHVWIRANRTVYLLTVLGSEYQTDGTKSARSGVIEVRARSQSVTSFFSGTCVCVSQSVPSLP